MPLRFKSGGLFLCLTRQQKQQGGLWSAPQGVTVEGIATANVAGKPRKKIMSATPNMPPPLDVADYFVDLVTAAPTAYACFKVMSVETIETRPGHAPKYKKRGELGRFPLENLQNPGLYALIAATYGGFEDGKPFDICLVKQDGKLGPQKRLFSVQDTRPAEVIQAQIQAPLINQTQAPHNGGYNPQMVGFGMGGPMGGQQMPHWGYMMMQEIRDIKSSPKEDSLTTLLINNMMQQQMDASKALSKGVATGMELAKEMQPTESLDIVGAIRAVSEAFSSTRGNQVAERIAQKTKSSEKEIIVERKEKETDFDKLGFIIYESISSKWPVDRSARFFLESVSKADIDKLKTGDIELISSFFEKAGNAYEPLKEYLSDAEIMSKWVSDISSFIAREQK